MGVDGLDAVAGGAVGDAAHRRGVGARAQRGGGLLEAGQAAQAGVRAAEAAAGLDLLEGGALVQADALGGASFPCRQATMAPARRSWQAAAGSGVLAASGAPAPSGPPGPVEATRATPAIRATTVAVAIVRRARRAGPRIGLPTLDARPCLIGGSADQLKRSRWGSGLPGPRMGGPAATQGRVTERCPRRFR